MRMGREHLYKAKRVNWRELPREEWWVEGALFEGKENSYIFTNVKVTDRWENSEIGADVIGYLVDPETVCEYTGLTDKNGKNIFESDIVCIFGNVGVIEIGNYEVYEYGYKINWINSAAKCYSESILQWLDREEGRVFSIIGNVFDIEHILE